jgi:predicted metal-dependent hydrolase
MLFTTRAQPLLSRIFNRRPRHAARYKRARRSRDRSNVERQRPVILVRLPTICLRELNVRRHKDLVNGGAMWWSPRSIEAETRRLEQKDLDKLQQEKDKKESANIHQANHILISKLKAVAKTQRTQAALDKQRDNDASAAAKIWSKNQAVAAKLSHQNKKKDKPKPASKRRVKKKQGSGGSSGALPGGPSSAPPAPPPQSRSGRHINPPTRYRNK